MAETSPESSESPARISNSDVLQAESSQPYQLTVKRGFLALFLMYAIQTSVGLLAQTAQRGVVVAGAISTQPIRAHEESAGVQSHEQPMWPASKPK